MKLDVFSVYDSKAEAFLQPFFCVNRGVAVRNFQAAAQDERHDFHRHAADFTLFRLGTWDQVTGEFEMAEVKESLGTAIQFQQKEAR